MGIDVKAVFKRSDEQNKTDDQTIMNVLFCLSCVKFRGCFSIRAIYQRQLDHGRSMVINDDQ